MLKHIYNYHELIIDSYGIADLGEIPISLHKMANKIQCYKLFMWHQNEIYCPDGSGFARE
jgi:hypothetical protein